LSARPFEMPPVDLADPHHLDPVFPLFFLGHLSLSPVLITSSWLRLDLTFFEFSLPSDRVFAGIFQFFFRITFFPS